MDTFSPNVADNPRYWMSTFNTNGYGSHGVERSSDVPYGDARLELGSAVLDSSIGKDSIETITFDGIKSRKNSEISANVDVEKLLNELDQFISSGRPSSSSFLMRTDTNDR